MSAVSAIERRDAIDTLAVAMMIGLTLSWGLNGVAAKLSNTGYSPVFLTLVRSALGGALVFAWCWWRGIRLFDRDGTLWAGMLAGLLFGIEFLLIFVGPRFHLGREEHAARQHDAVLGARRRPFSTWRAHHGEKDRRATARLRRPGGDFLRQAQPARARGADRRPDEPRCGSCMGGDKHRHQANQACQRRCRKTAAVPARRGRGRRGGRLTVRRPVDS